MAAYEGNEPGGDESLAAARQGLDRELDRLHDAGADADGEIGDHDPLEAIPAALENHQIDEIILSTLPAGISRWLAPDLPHRVQRRFHLPLTHVESHRGPVAVTAGQHPPDVAQEPTEPLGRPDDDRSKKAGRPKNSDDSSATSNGFALTSPASITTTTYTSTTPNLPPPEPCGEPRGTRPPCRTVARERSAERGKRQPLQATEPQQKLIQLRCHIEQARKDLADTRHEGDRRFCD